MLLGRTAYYSRHERTLRNGDAEALGTSRAQTAPMYQGVIGAIAIGLALSGCTSTRSPINSGCTSELMYQGTTYCTYGDTTREDSYRPTIPLGTAQPWHDGRAISSQDPVPVRGFHFVSPSRVIAVRVSGSRHDLVLYLTEYSSVRWRKKFLQYVNISAAHP
jgi:hypothetical protein